MPIVRKFATSTIAGAVVFFTNLFVFWFIWAKANVIASARAAPWVWTALRIISFPVFSVAPANFAMDYFWRLAILNAFVWGSAAAFIAGKTATKRNPTRASI